MTPLFGDAIYTATDFRAGVALRGIIYIFAIAAIAYTSFREYKLLSYFAFYPIFIGFMSSAFYGGVILNVTEAAKYSYIFTLTILFASQFRKATITEQITFITNAGLIASLLILIPFILGVGRHTYFEGAYGNKGFFSAQNDVGLALLLSLITALSQAYETRNPRELLKSIIIISSLIVLGTRLSLAGAFFIPFCFVLKLRFKLIAATTIVALVFAASLYSLLAGVLSLGDFESQKFENISYFGDKGRLALLEGAKSFFAERSLIEHAFGSGTYEYLSQTFQKLSHLRFIGGLKAVEMDPIDLFGQYGLFFTLTVYLYLLNIIYTVSSSITPENRVKAKSIMIGIALVITNSIFAGHTFNNPIAAPLIALLLTTAALITKSKPKAPSLAET